MGTPRTPLLQRLMAKTIITDTGCWEWTGSVNWCGYGQISVYRDGRKTNLGTHRAAYLFYGPPFDEALTLDHLCGNRRCWRFDHLEPVTLAENIDRAPTHVGKRTHCPQGHEYTEANTAIWRNKRSCRTCHAARQRERTRKAKEAG